MPKYQIRTWFQSKGFGPWIDLGYHDDANDFTKWARLHGWLDPKNSIWKWQVKEILTNTDGTVVVKLIRDDVPKQPKPKTSAKPKPNPKPTTVGATNIVEVTKVE